MFYESPFGVSVASNCCPSRSLATTNLHRYLELAPKGQYASDLRAILDSL